METQKIVNFLNSPENEYSRFGTKKWYVLDRESKGGYSHQDSMNFLTKSIETSLCDYSDAYILVTGNVNVTGGDNNAKVAFKNCAPFKDCRTEINDTFVDYADFINIAMPMYNLIEYSDSCSYSSGSLWGFKSDDVANNADMTNDDYAPSFKYKAIRFTDVEANGRKNDVKIAVPPKYLSNFWRSLEMLLISCRLVLMQCYWCYWCR